MAMSEGRTGDEEKSSKATMIDVPFQRVNPKIGIIRVGRRGTSLLKKLLAADAQVTAICEVVPEKAGSAR
jgi:hypothetical protein